MLAQGKKRRGKGIFQDVRNKFEKITKGVQSQAVDLRDKVVDAGTQLLAKPTKVSAKVRGILKTMGDKTIVSAEVVRSPVQSIVQQAINFVSGGEF